jgi:hypothetical protein
MPHPLYRHIALLPVEYAALACYLNIEIFIRGSGAAS